MKTSTIVIISVIIMAVIAMPIVFCGGIILLVPNLTQPSYNNSSRLSLDTITDEDLHLLNGKHQSEITLMYGHPDNIFPQSGGWVYAVRNSHKNAHICLDFNGAGRVWLVSGSTGRSKKK